MNTTPTDDPSQARVLFSNSCLQVTPLPCGVPDTLWSAQLDTSIPAKQLTHRLRQVGMVVVNETPGIWELHVQDASSSAQVMVVARSRLVVIRIGASIDATQRRETALRISQMLGLVARTFTRRSWRIRRPRRANATVSSLHVA